MSDALSEIYEYQPDEVLPPGATLLEWLTGHDMSQAELARRTSLSTKHISQVVNGGAGLSPEVALALENVTATPARYWIQLESNHRAHSARLADDQALAKQVSILKKFPVTELVHRGVMSNFSDPVRQLRELLRFFGVATVDALEGVCLSGTKLRTSRAYAPNEASLASWLRLAELEAQSVTVAPFDAEECEAAIGDMRSYSKLGEVSWLDALKERCASVGIALVVVKELPKCRVNGATRWLSSSKAMIALSLRHRRHDVVWFTFFHELGHLLRHSRKQTFVDATGSQVAADLELDADRFASRTLIAPEHEAELREVTTTATARALADRLGVDVSIVVGRLQHEHLILFSQWNSLIRTYRFGDDS
jgi:HTH-type transcriptional regulator/antitoxin HigA